MLTESAIFESVNKPSGEKGVTEYEEENTRVTTSVALLGESECLERLKTLVTKQEDVPDTVIKSIAGIEKICKISCFNSTK